MAIRYKALTELYQETQRSVTAPDQWRAFLASACRNYRLSFYEQLLVYAQRPDATAVLEIERWNRQFGRWVNRGANGIAVFDWEHNGKSRLKYYFDISDTHEARFPRPVPLWTVREEYAPDIIETLENSFGELEHKEDLGEALLSAAKNAVEDNMPDYLSELKTLTEGSFLEELDELNLEVEYRRAVQNSIGYMLLVRCGLDPSDYFEDEDFRDVLNFNTPQTLNALGVATGDISQMCLSAISRTVLALKRQPQKENRTFEPQQKNQYGLNEGVKFHLTGVSLAGIPVDEYAVTGSNGKAVFSDVLIGTDYILSEVDTGICYVVPEDQTTAVEWNTVTQAEVCNVLKKWSATVTKRDAETGLPQGDATLAGAVYGVFKGEELVDTYTTSESGQFTTTDYVCGDDWTIRELSPSEGYLLDDTVYLVGAEPQRYTEEYNPIALDVTEQVIRGGVALTKVDKDYPENKLEGAVFEVYRDSNRNQKLDAEDELLGTMEELGGGEYALTGLCYGGYFAKEAQAPEGFYLDENAYYFAITTDGETVTVENEAGKGFVNAAQVGSLRIVKTSSDGKLEGFSFRVTGANGYDQVFQTDAEGFILVEGLRIGDYTVSEVRDGSSDGYLLPADKTASIFEGAVTEVEMHNEKKPALEVPQTGDNSHMALWLGLLGISGIGAAAILLMRKRKK